MIDAVVDVVAGFVVAERLADDLRDRPAGRRHEKPPRLGEDLDGRGEEPVELVADRLGKRGELRHAVVVGRGESAADVEELELEAPALRLGEHAGAEVEGLDVVLRIRALAADVEREPLDDKIVLVGILDQPDGLSRQGAELARQLNHRAGVRHPHPQREPGVRRVLGDLLHLLVVVIGDEGAVLVELAERLRRLDRVGVDDLVPDEVLPGLLREMLDELMDGVEFLHARHVEAATGLVEGLDDRRIAVDLHGVVDLHPGEVLAEGGVVAAQFGVVDDEQGRAVGLGELEQRGGSHVAFCQPPSGSRKFLNCQGSSRSRRESTGPRNGSYERFSGVQSL